MDPMYQNIKQLHQQEIDAYRAHIEELRSSCKKSDETNFRLNARIQELQKLIDQAHVANQDLHIAFDHIREENQKLLQQQTQIEPRQPDSNELALEKIEKQYVNLARESVSWISDKDNFMRKIKFLERECARYERDNLTLNKQVRHLLKALEEERGMIIRRSDQVHDVEKPTCASEVIDKHLVTFESIEELQQQNQKLLSLVKELSREEEEREEKFQNENIQSLNQEIASLKEQLEKVKEGREHLKETFNTILKERDLFKILLCKTREVEHMTPEIFQRMVSVACSANPAIESGSQINEAHVSDLRETIKKLEQKVVALQTELDELRQQNDVEIKLKTDLLNQAHLNLMEKSSLASELADRNKTLEENINNVTTEFEEARSHLMRLKFDLEQATQVKKELSEALEAEKKLRHQDLASLLTEVQTQAKLSRAEKELEELTDQLNSTIEHNEELRSQLEEERMNLAACQDNEALIADLRETISELEQKVDALQTELEEVREQSDAEIKMKTDLLNQAHLNLDEKSSLASELADRNKTLEENLINVTTELEEARSHLMRLEFDLEQATQVKKELSQALEAEKDREKSSLASELADRDKTLEENINNVTTELEEARSQVMRLKFDLEQANQVKKELIEALEAEKKPEESSLASELADRNKTLEENIINVTTELEEARSHLMRLKFDLEQATQVKKELSEALEAEKKLKHQDLASLPMEVQAEVEVPKAETEIEKPAEQPNVTVEHTEKLKNQNELERSDEIVLKRRRI